MRDTSRIQTRQFRVQDLRRGLRISGLGLNPLVHILHAETTPLGMLNLQALLYEGNLVVALQVGNLPRLSMLLTETELQHEFADARS